MGQMGRRIRAVFRRDRARSARGSDGQFESSAESAELPEPGPELWRNWRAFDLGHDYQGGFEAVFYTDAHVVGQPDQPFGPYQLFNAIGRDPWAHPGELGVGLALRADWHLPVDPNGPDRPRKSDASHWVSLPLSDQLACLLSLVLGARLRSGGEVRDFSTQPDADLAGRPMFFMHKPPSLTVPLKGSVIPDVAGAQVSMEGAESFVRSFGLLNARTATFVLRAARLFRQALWIADEDCELAWLLMVSAVETAATQWHPKGNEPPMLLADQNPELADLLREEGGQALLDRAASLMVLNRPTAATQSFLLTFASPPDEEARPLEWARFDFSRLKQAVQTIYGYRSKALHSGLPFPAPLLDAPWQGDMPVPAEVPTGHWTQHGAHTIWMAKDLPMHFHTFAGLSRRALLAWWNELACEESSPTE